METIHEIIKESVSGGFCKFSGYFMMSSILLMTVYYILELVKEILVHLIYVPIKIWAITKYVKAPKKKD